MKIYRRAKIYLLYRVCIKLVDEFLKHDERNLEKLNAAGGIRKILMLERKMEQPLQVSGSDIKVSGKSYPDRVESINGMVSIADYKTGTPVGSSVNTDDVAQLVKDPKYAKAVQLLMYAWLYSRRNTGDAALPIRSGIYWLRDSSEGFDPLIMNGSELITELQLTKFEEAITEVLSELLNPQVPFYKKTPEIERCIHCEFAAICRRN